MPFSLVDYLASSYLTLLMLGGILIIYLVTRQNPPPASRHTLPIILILAALSVSTYLDEASAGYPEWISLRYAVSAVTYTLFPVLLYLELSLLTKSRVLARFLSVPCVFIGILAVTSPITGGIFTFFDEYNHFVRGPLGYLPYVVCLLYLGLLLLFSYRSFREDGSQLIFLVVFTVFSILLTSYLEYRSYLTNLMDDVTAFNVLIYYTFLSYIYQKDLERQHLADQLELAQKQIFLLQGQIQPHFIFNILNILRALIRLDPPRATECLDCFTAYLRLNLEAFRSERQIPFTRELEHTKAYITLSCMASSKNIDVEYDLPFTDFLIPPLTIEPLVENAIRHGIALRPENGKVKISTRHEGNLVTIRIWDSGPGQNDRAATPQQAKEKNTALQNVRTRLALQCNGTLTMEYSEEGTCATVLIDTAYPLRNLEGEKEK